MGILRATEKDLKEPEGLWSFTAHQGPGCRKEPSTHDGRQTRRPGGPLKLFAESCRQLREATKSPLSLKAEPHLFLGQKLPSTCSVGGGRALLSPSTISVPSQGILRFLSFMG